MPHWLVGSRAPLVDLTAKADLAIDAFVCELTRQLEQEEAAVTRGVRQAGEPFDPEIVSDMLRSRKDVRRARDSLGSARAGKEVFEALLAHRDPKYALAKICSILDRWDAQLDGTGDTPFSTEAESLTPEHVRELDFGSKYGTEAVGSGSNANR